MLCPGDEPTRPCGEPGRCTLSPSNSSHRHNQLGGLLQGDRPTAKRRHSGPRIKGLSHRIGARCVLQTAGRNPGAQLPVPAGTPGWAIHSDLGGKTNPATHYASTIELIHQEGTNHRKDYTTLRWIRRKSLLNKDGSIKKRMLGVKELAEYLGLKAQTIYNKVAAGTFPIKHRRIGRLLKWDILDVNVYLDSLPANY